MRWNRVLLGATVLAVSAGVSAAPMRTLTVF